MQKITRVPYYIVYFGNTNREFKNPRICLYEQSTEIVVPEYMFFHNSWVYI